MVVAAAPTFKLPKRLIEEKSSAALGAVLAVCVDPTDGSVLCSDAHSVRRVTRSGA
jgi:hypothetical protein